MGNDDASRRGRVRFDYPQPLETRMRWALDAGVSLGLVNKTIRVWMEVGYPIPVSLAARRLLDTLDNNGAYVALDAYAKTRAANRQSGQ